MGMRFEVFGAALAGIDAVQQARFVLVAGAAPRALQALLEGSADEAALAKALERAASAPALSVSLPGVRRIGAMLDLPPVRARVLAGLAAWCRRLSAAGPRSVALSGAARGVSPAALVQALCALPEVSDAWFEFAAPGASLWEWPLRIGVPRDDAALWQRFAGARYGELFKVEPVGHDDRIVDLLLCRGDLRVALGAVPGARTVADAVLLLGGADVDEARLKDGIAALASRYHAGAIGLCAVAAGEEQAWFQALVRELSHNRGLPASLFTARRADARRQEQGDPAIGDFPAPLLHADPGFIAGTFIADAAGRLAARLQDAPKEATVVLAQDVLGNLGLDTRLARVRQIGRALKSQLPSLGWTNEGGDARSLVRVRRALEGALGRIDTAAPVAPPAMRAPAPMPADDGFAMSPPPDDLAPPPPRSGDAPPVMPPPNDLPMAAPPPDDGPPMSPPPAAADPHGAAPDAPPGDPRYVQALVLREDAPEAPDAAPVRLVPDTDYRVRVHIGADRGGPQVRANVALDETRLPDQPEGHDLTLAWVPLSPARDGAGRRTLPPPASAGIHLPRAGDSSAAEFDLRCGAQPADFRARLLVLHENRVLQTLLMTADAAGACALREENRYVPGFASASAGTPADIAFVINDSPAGVSGITTVAGGAVSFDEPEGMKASLQSLRKAVAANVVVSVGDEDAALGSEANLKLMRLLAKHGASILGLLQAHYPLGEMATAARVQVVEAIAEAFFPVEFLYSGRSPLPEATLCPNAAAALAPGGEAVHAGCPHRDSRDHVCPAAFWGMSKCIERHAHGDSRHRLSVPTPGEERIGPFTSALLAASQIAQAEMDGPTGVPATLGKLVPKLTRVESWRAWEERIADTLPDLLVLLPHTGKSTIDPAIPSLEISNLYLDADNIEPLHVRAPALARPGPLVLLLGCGTSVAEIDFMGTVGRFVRSGAPIVVGTLSVIHSTQAALLATRLLQATGAPAHAAQRFDEAMLAVKRSLLADGHGMAFTLVAYGHSAWRL
ncbi:hypothetical protein N787_06545 [Arenimonas metalli CF5-1]|uniref:CHAT domain-containing protein n=2 Tax=Arenimonas TaxID=490567 RepID=A0A091B627_9GAMM|nr:hypothetical protein N787_06545 [Arenimonas metalli CF5-1]